MLLKGPDAAVALTFLLRPVDRSIVMHHRLPDGGRQRYGGFSSEEHARWVAEKQGWRPEDVEIQTKER